MKRVIALVLGIGVAVGMVGCGGGSEAHPVVAYFRDVGDLVDGATVQVNDVKVGSVSDIALVMRDGAMAARVEMNLDPDARVSATDLTALIRQTSLLGEQFVDLVPTTSGPPYVGAEATTIPLDRTDRRVDVETFLGDLSSFIGGGGLEDLNRFTHAQALILEDRGARFGNVIEELERFTKVLAERRFDVERAIDHLAGAGATLAHNRQTLDSFLDSLDDANALLASEGGRLRALFTGLQRFGRVNSRFLARHEGAIDRGFRALRPIFSHLAAAQGDLRVDLRQLNTFLELFPKSLGGGPGGNGAGDYVQADAVLCEQLNRCHTKGEKGDVPGEGS
ncbi:MAG TPA: MCE family protein [Actinomycetota bacterium]|nr:MCE family protein [Actinomycetota bacterium]